MKNQQKLTKQILEKYNIYIRQKAVDCDIYCLKTLSTVFFMMWETNNGKWVYSYQNDDDSIRAYTIIETEEELVTALKFSKLYEQAENTPPIKGHDCV